MHTLIVAVARYLFVVPIVIVVWLLITLPNRSRLMLALYLIVGGVVALVLAKLGNRYIADPRPFIKDGVTPWFQSSKDNGFPSDHSLLSYFLALVTLRFNRWLGLNLLVLATLIGWARVISGVHHARDVVGSFIIALVALGVAWGVELVVRRARPELIAETKNRIATR